MLSAVALAPCIAWAVADVVDGVAAIVNDRVITYSQVREYVMPAAQQLRRSYSGQDLVDRIKAAQQDALNGLIERALIVQEFKDKGFSFPDTVVDEELNQVIASDFGGDRAAFTRTLAAENMTLSQYREQLRDRIIVQAMRQRKAQQEIVVSPYKIEKYYQDDLDQFKLGDQIKLRMIFIKTTPAQPAPALPPPVTSQPAGGTSAVDQATGAITNETPAPAVTEAASTSTTNEPAPVEAAPAPAPVDPRRRLAEELLSKLDAGDSFDSMARVYSEGKESREGGDWGWIGRDVLRKELNEVAFTLKPGQHSQVIDTAEGYYILQVDDVNPAHTKPLSEVRGEIEKILLQQQRIKVQEQWVKSLRAKAYIRLF